MFVRRAGRTPAPLTSRAVLAEGLILPEVSATPLLYFSFPHARQFFFSFLLAVGVLLPFFNVRSIFSTSIGAVLLAIALSELPVYKLQARCLQEMEASST